MAQREGDYEMIDIQELRKLAINAGGEKWHTYSEELCIILDPRHDDVAECYDNDEAAFIAAANPATIIELLDRLEMLEAVNKTEKVEIQKPERYSSLRDYYGT